MLNMFQGLRRRAQEELRLAKLRYPEGHPMLEKIVAEVQDLEKKIAAANRLLKESLGWERRQTKKDTRSKSQD